MTEKNKKIKILPAITTTRGSNWREKLKEADDLRLEELALFPTALDKEERKELYSLLERISIKSIPFVHLRSDMELAELDYFIKKYGTKVFNTHTEKEYPFIYDYRDHRNMVFIENVYEPLDENEIKNFGGICLDISHLENDRRLHKENFDHDKEIIEKYPIGCNHVSAISEYTYVDESGNVRCAPHYLKSLSQLDYLKKYPLKYFSPYIAIELENSLKEQLEARDYIKKLLGIF